MNALVIDHEPFDMEREIAVIVARRLGEMRDRQRHDAYKEACRAAFRDDLRARRRQRLELPALAALMFVGVLSVAWVAELRLAGIIAEQTMRSM